MRKLFVHVGPTKTGSSAIQALFKESRTREILYPETGRWPDGSHHKLVFSQRGIERYGLIDIPPWSQLLDSLEHEISNSGKNILISSEVCQVEFIKNLLPLVKKYRLDLQPILVIRNPLERAASLYNQSVKDPVIGLNEEPDEFLTLRKDRFRIRPLYSSWLNICEKVITLPYRDKLPLVQRFCSAIDISINTDSLEKRYNRSMGGHALIAILIANKLLSKEEKRRDFFEQLRNDQSFRVWSGDSFPFGYEACESFLDANKSDIAWARDHLKIMQEQPSDVCGRRFTLSENDTEKINFHLDKFGLLRQNKESISKILEHFSK